VQIERLPVGLEMILHCLRVTTKVRAQVLLQK
jgi:hypothetical protein